MINGELQIENNLSMNNDFNIDDFDPPGGQDEIQLNFDDIEDSEEEKYRTEHNSELRRYIVEKKFEENSTFMFESFLADVPNTDPSIAFYELLELQCEGDVVCSQTGDFGKIEITVCIATAV